VTEEGSAYFGTRHTPSSQWLLRSKKSVGDAMDHWNFTHKYQDDKGKSIETYVRVFDASYQPTFRTFRKIQFEPSILGDVEGQFINLFRGFKAQEVDVVDMDKVTWYLDHS